MDDENRYRILQDKEEAEWESKCTRCGSCCGAYEGDPCENLEKSPDGKFSCRIYENRFGERKTIHGRVFQCVPLRWIIHQHWPGDHLCGYKKSKSE